MTIGSRSIIIPMVAALALSLPTPAGAAQPGSSLQLAQSTSTGQKPVPEGETANIILADARQRGMEKCIERVKEITDRVLGDAEIGGYVIVNDDNPDSGIYTAMVSRPNGRGGTQMVSLSVSPDDNCSASYDITSVWGAACPRIAQRWFPSYEPVVQLPGNVVVRSAAEKQQVYMVPLPDGCMTIEKATVH